MANFVRNILIAVDQLGNALTGGDPDETISSRMGKSLVDPESKCLLCKPICWLLDLVDPNHCINSIDHFEGHDEVWDWNKRQIRKHRKGK